MKVLFLTNHLKGTDGYSRYSIDFIKEIKASRHQVLVLQYPALDKPSRYLVNLGRIFLASFKVKKAIREFSPDVIHFMAEPYANILPFLGKLKARTYLTCHGTYAVIPNLMSSFVKKKISVFLSKRYFRKLTGVVAVSNYTRNYLLKHYPEIASKVEVITNGIDLEKNPPIDLDKKPQNKTKKILFVGSVKERKGVLQAVEACKTYRDNFSADLVYDIVGNCDKNSGYYQTIYEKIKEYRLENKVFFRGKVTEAELKEYYLNADLFLMPSLNVNHNFEGFGLVFLEAAVRGVPSIGSFNSGCQEAILDGKTGYLVDPSDPQNIARKMNLVLNENAINGRDCINWAIKNDVKIKTRELIDFYQNQQ